jgi:hypothetical protein
MASDPFYRQACLERPRNWRAAHPVPLYWKQYRLDHPYISATKVNLANNNLAFDLKHFAKPSILETIVAQSEGPPPIPSSPVKNSNPLLLLTIL